MSYTRIDIIEPCYAEFGAWAAERRGELGLIQMDIAKLLGMSRGSVANMEIGNQRTPYHTVLLLQKALRSPQAFRAAMAKREQREEDLILMKAEQISHAREAKRKKK